MKRQGDAGSEISNLKFEISELELAVRQARYGLDVMGLREHIKTDDGVKRITAGQQLVEVARQRGRITRDVANLLRRDRQNSFNDTAFRAGARRVEQEQLGPLKAKPVFQPFRHAHVRNFDVVEFGCVQI